MTLHEQLEDQFKVYAAEAKRFEEKGIKASATRARKALAEISSEEARFRRPGKSWKTEPFGIMGKNRLPRRTADKVKDRPETCPLLLSEGSQKSDVLACLGNDFLEFSLLGLLLGNCLRLCILHELLV